MGDAGDKPAALERLRARVEQCRSCILGASRTNAVFGDGGTASGLMFIGEAPGYHEDQQGLPFVGRAGNLLAKLLSQIGLEREDVYIANVLKCRPPENRDPEAAEIDSCYGWLMEQISIINPRVICTLGNFATKLLSGKPDGISRIHGKPLQMPGREGVTCIYPVYHPAAALYTPANLHALENDFKRLPELLGAGSTSDKALLISDKSGNESRIDGISEAAPTAIADCEPEQLVFF